MVCRNENENLSFRQIATSVPVVFEPCYKHSNVNLARPRTEQSTYISKEEEGNQVHEGVRELLVLLEHNPYLLPPDSDIMFALRKRRARTWLLKDN